MKRSLFPKDDKLKSQPSTRPEQFMRIYTLGYQQISLQEYVNALVESGIGVVLDVREVAWSYKPGFSKSQLQKALALAGIDYVHVPSAGNPSANRKTAKTPAECLRRYRRYLQANLDCIDELLVHVRRASRAGRPACLTCYERKPIDCHRSILIDALEAVEPRLRPTHLEVLDVKTGPLQLALDTRSQRS